MSSYKVLLTVALLCLAGSAAGSSDIIQEYVTLGEGESLEYEGSEIRFENMRGAGYSLDFEDSRGVLIEQFSGIDFYEQLGEWANISEKINFKPKSVDRDDSELDAVVEAPENYFGSSEINFTAPNYIVKKAGESFTVPVKIENKGGIKETYELRSRSDSKITTSYQFEGYNITKLEIEAGEEKTVDLEFDLDDEMSNGLYTVNYSISDESFSSKNFSFQVINSSEDERGLSMRLEQSYSEREAGGELSTEFRVRNIGDNEVEDVNPTISVPENWNHSLDPDEADNISSDEFQDFELDVDVPSTASSGDYFIDIGLENTEDFDEKNIRVNVSSQSSGLGVLGILLALLSVLLVGGVYKVFGRR